MLTIKIISILFICSLAAFSQGQLKTADKNKLLDQYVSVWNEGSIDKLNNIADNNFQIRIVPDFEASTGIDKLKEAITETRTHFPDFHITETERLAVSDTAMVIRWNLTGTFTNVKSPATGNKVNVPGFSVIFFANDKVSGEWIAYSDLTWFKQLGYSLVYKTRD